jgi:hypothetical protein
MEIFTDLQMKQVRKINLAKQDSVRDPASYVNQGNNSIQIKGPQTGLIPIQKLDSGEDF